MEVLLLILPQAVLMGVQDDHTLGLLVFCYDNFYQDFFLSTVNIQYCPNRKYDFLLIRSFARSKVKESFVLIKVGW